MMRTFFSLFAALLFGFGSVFAADATPKNLGTMPNSMLWRIDTAGESISRFFLFSAQKRFLYDLSCIEERSIEAATMLDQNEFESAKKALVAYTALVLKLSENMVLIQKNGDSVGEFVSAALSRVVTDRALFQVALSGVGKNEDLSATLHSIDVAVEEISATVGAKLNSGLFIEPTLGESTAIPLL